jgi:group I intron endonuclease
MSNTEYDLQDTTKKTELKSAKESCNDIGIYGLQNKLKPEKWNVGQTRRPFAQRWKDYQGLKCKRQRKIYNALLKYGYDGFNKIILEVCPLDKLDEREIYWINKLNCIKNGYNVLPGGHGHGHSPEARKNISLAQKGRKKRPCSEETKRKIRAARIGWRPSAETLLNMSKGQKGRITSDETKKKLSKTSRGRKMPDAAKEKIRRWNLGRKYSEESKRKMSESRLKYFEKKRMENSTSPEPLISHQI